LLRDAYNPKDLGEYPGSKRGPSPKDDPDFFARWVAENIPQDIKDRLAVR